MSSQITHRERHWDDTPWSHRWDHLSYRVRVRAADTADSPLYLWGSGSIAQPIVFQAAPLFHIRNDELGEPVTIGTAIGSKKTPIGTLLPGECISIPVLNITGIYASWPTATGGTPAPTITTETTVSCFIKTS